jgi:hypothetical protein
MSFCPRTPTSLGAACATRGWAVAAFNRRKAVLGLDVAPALRLKVQHAIAGKLSKLAAGSAASMAAMLPVAPAFAGVREFAETLQKQADSIVGAADTVSKTTSEVTKAAQVRAVATAAAVHSHTTRSLTKAARLPLARRMRWTRQSRLPAPT